MAPSLIQSLSSEGDVFTLDSHRSRGDLTVKKQSLCKLTSWPVLWTDCSTTSRWDIYIPRKSSIPHVVFPVRHNVYNVPSHSQAWKKKEKRSVCLFLCCRDNHICRNIRKCVVILCVTAQHPGGNIASFCFFGFMETLHFFLWTDWYRCSVNQGWNPLSYNTVCFHRAVINEIVWALKLLLGILSQARSTPKLASTPTQPSTTIFSPRREIASAYYKDAKLKKKKRKWSTMLDSFKDPLI